MVITINISNTISTFSVATLPALSNEVVFKKQTAKFRELCHLLSDLDKIPCYDCA